MDAIELAAVLVTIALVASMVSVELGVTVALLELTFGVVAGNVFDLQSQDWLTFGGGEVRFRRPVVPGDQLLLRATLTRRIRTIWRFATVAEVEGQEACSAELMVMPG